MYESRGKLRGLLLGDLFFGRYKGTNQSRFSKMVRPPAKFPSATPAILWLVGFFSLMAFLRDGSRLGGLRSIASRASCWSIRLQLLCLSEKVQEMGRRVYVPALGSAYQCSHQRAISAIS